jgi:hypothetical protein
LQGRSSNRYGSFGSNEGLYTRNRSNSNDPALYQDFQSFNKSKEWLITRNDTGDKLPEGAASPVAAAERSQFCDFNSCIDDSICVRDSLIPSKNLDSIRQMMNEGNQPVPLADSSSKPMNII